MANYDEWILRAGRVDPAAPFPVLHQALRIALYDTYRARAFCARVAEAFGPRPPFAAVARDEQRHLDALAQLCDRFGVPRPLDPFLAETSVAPGWRRNCERAVAGKMGSILRYENLLAVVAEPSVRRLFTALQATARDHHLPAFRAAAADALALERYHAGHGIAPQQAYVRHGPFSDLLERALSQLAPHVGPLGFLAPFVRHVHPTLLAGMAAGGAGAYLLKKRIGRHQEER